MTLRKKDYVRILDYPICKCKGWIRTMVLMAIARVLSPERDSPYLWFCCCRRMEFQTKTLFSAIPSRFHLRFLEFSMKDSSSCVPVVVHSDFPVDS